MSEQDLSFFSIPWEYFFKIKKFIDWLQDKVRGIARFEPVKSKVLSQRASLSFPIFRSRPKNYLQ